MSKELEKAYNPSSVEESLYQSWEESGYFSPEKLPDFEDRKESFSIVLPPPNVTGTLHMGHAAMLAIEDSLVRYHRLSGKKTLWIPGTDHAAIATQAKVEKVLIAEGMEDPRKELGREKFLERVEEFAKESHDTITHQIRKMGASIDWSREAYTLDEKRSLAVKTAFKSMYEDGLIYRGDRVINWCPRCKSTLADDEVEHKEVSSKLYTFKYDKDFPISISTTRPETKFGDTAVAVHPKDKRYEDLVGKTLEAEYAGNKLSLKIIADSSVDQSFGTGALGVTPAHSNSDAEMGKEHELKSVQVINEEGKMMNSSLVDGLSAIDARKKAVEWLMEQDLLESEEDIGQNLSVCYRCDSAVEPLPKIQWFIDVNKEFDFKQSKQHPIKGLKDGKKVTLKQLMQHTVKSGEIEILPDMFKKTYFHWIDNLRDWNISRQIWFGHRVPVWYKGKEMVVGEEPKEEGWKQDPDTLDTWFSSGLWTFATLGWPNETEELKLYHPTTVLETGYDILFFWVARMILMTTYHLGEVPFETVYLHGLVRDEKGRKMSKSLGNAIDPLDTISEYGADATRLSLLVGSSPGNDTKLSEEKIASFRNFTNKLWNISRFILMSVSGEAGPGSAGEGVKSVKEMPDPKTLADKWILHRLSQVTKEVTQHFEKYELSILGEKLRAFTWNDLADWYLEISKVQMKDEKEHTEKMLLYILENVLTLWHPFMPFVTEELYKQFDKGMLMVASWPKVEYENKEDAGNFETLKEIISAVRNIRATYNIAPKQLVNIALEGSESLQEYAPLIERLARVESVSFDAPKERAAFQAVDSIKVSVILEGLIDFKQEKIRLEKELENIKNYSQSLEKKLSNKEYTKNAPKEVVKATEEELEKTREHVTLIEKQLNALS